jgi:uncharacterized protein YbcI
MRAVLEGIARSCHRPLPRPRACYPSRPNLNRSGSRNSTFRRTRRSGSAPSRGGRCAIWPTKSSNQASPPAPGSTKAKTVWRDEIVVCILEDLFTKAEQLLVDGGRFEDVRAHRTAFQDEVEPLFRGCVEAVTGRRVRSFLSQVSIDGVASEVFVLGAAIGDGPESG